MRGPGMLVVGVVVASLATTPRGVFAQQGWSGEIATLAAPGYGPEVVVDGTGHVTAVWVAGGVRASRLDPASGAWSQAADISPAGGIAAGPVAAVDPQGNVTAAWVWSSTTGDALVQAASFIVSTGTWTPAASLSALTAGQRLRLGGVVADPTGRATVVWARGEADPDTLWTAQAARYTVADAAWGASVSISTPAQDVSRPEVAADAAGNVTAAWIRADGLSPASRLTVQAARLTMPDNAWGTARDLSVPTTPSSHPVLSPWNIAVDAAGDTTVAWSRVDGSTSGGRWVVQAARYSAPAASWSAAATLSPEAPEALYGQLAVDRMGAITAVWTQVGEVGAEVLEAIMAARFGLAPSGWTAPVTLSAPVLDATSISVLTHPLNGSVTAVWDTYDGSLWRVQGARAPEGSTAWSAPMDVVALPQLTGPHSLAVGDGAGNIFLLWHAAGGLRVARYASATEALAGPEWLSQTGPGNSYIFRRLVIDSAGRATAVWNRCQLPTCVGLIIESTRWLATPSAPALGFVAPGTGALTVGFGPPTTIDPAFAATNYEYSADDGGTWTPRVPASTVSPLRIGGLSDGVAYTVRLRAVNQAGSGVPSAPVTATPVPAPEAPSGLHIASKAGRTVTLRWVAPVTGLAPAGYVLEGGRVPGEVVASIPTGSIAPVFTFTVPAGSYYARVHAVAAGAWSPPSNEIVLLVDVPDPPSAPANLLGLVNGSSAALSWTNTFAGGVPTSLWLQVTGTIATALPLPMGDTFALAGVPPGAYTLSLVASNTSGVSPSSNAVTLTFPGPCSGSPEAPTNFQTWKLGSTIFVSWTPPAGGPAVTSYTVQVSGAYLGSITTAGRSLSGTAAPGSYTLSVAANNPCGTGAATPAQVVVIP